MSSIAFLPEEQKKRVKRVEKNAFLSPKKRVIFYFGQFVKHGAWGVANGLNWLGGSSSTHILFSNPCRSKFHAMVKKRSSGVSGSYFHAVVKKRSSGVSGSYFVPNYICKPRVFIG